LFSPVMTSEKLSSIENYDILTTSKHVMHKPATGFCTESIPSSSQLHALFLRSILILSSICASIVRTLLTQYFMLLVVIYRTNKYLQKSSITRICAVGGFFISIPVFLTGKLSGKPNGLQLRGRQFGYK